MLESVNLFFVHSIVHVVSYTIPRWLFALLVRAPVTLWELITFKRRFTYSFKAERHIKVVTTGKDHEASTRLRDVCGLSNSMFYDDPLYSGHVHTLLGAARVGRRVKYDRELVEGEDTNPICLDWLRVPRERRSHLKAVVLVIPGVGNYGQTPYIQRLARLLVRNNFDCCVLTPRGMGSAPLTVPRMTCATFSMDICSTLRKRFATPMLEEATGSTVPLYALGYSGGGTMLMKALAEEAHSADAASHYPAGLPVSLCICMNAPYDMEVHAHAMLTRVGRLLYQKAILTALRKYSRKHWNVLKDGIPGIEGLKGEEMRKKMERLQTVEDFDEHVVAPHFGYKHATDYYRDAYGPKWAKQVDRSVAVVCVAARDDPIVGYGVTAAHWQRVSDEAPNVAYVETPVGGHLAYFRGPVDEYLGRPGFLIQFPLEVLESFHAAPTGLWKTAKSA